MRILWITPGFAAGPHDTTCIPPLQLLAQELLRRGVELHVIALEYPFRGEPYWWGNPDLGDRGSPGVSTPPPSPPPKGRGARPLFTHPSQFGMPIVYRDQAPLPFGGGDGGGVDTPGEPSTLKLMAMPPSPPPKGRGTRPRFTHPCQFGMPNVDREQAPLPFGGGDGGGVDTPGDPSSLKLMAMEAGGGAPVYPCDGRNRRWLRWRTLMRARRFARQLFAEKPFDVLHSFWLGPAWVLGEQLAAEWQTPHLTTLMGQDVLPSNRYLKRLNADAAKRLVALTPFHNAQLEKHSGFQAAHCIPWGLAGEDIPQSPPGERAVDVVGVGSLIPVKNWEQWLRVLRIVAENRPGLQAELIGGGPHEKRLRRLAGQLELERQVRFTGALPRAEVLARLRDSRVLLHTAHFESFGMVLAEAAANGCRVVSTPVGVAPALGDCAESDTALAGALLKALEMPVKVPGEVTPLRIEDCAERYLELYSSNRLL